MLFAGVKIWLLRSSAAPQAPEQGTGATPAPPGVQGCTGGTAPLATHPTAESAPPSVILSSTAQLEVFKFCLSFWVGLVLAGGPQAVLQVTSRVHGAT